MRRDSIRSRRLQPAYFRTHPKGCDYGLMVVALILLFGCGKKGSPVRVEEFSGTNAWRHVEHVVGIGPRPSGSKELGQTAGYIAEQLRAAGLTVEEQTFHSGTPRGPMMFRNVIGRTRGRNDRVIVVGTHYDTKWLPEIRFVGANDGGSGVGVLLEMARVAAKVPGLWFVFFDGEEAMGEYGTEDGLWGSKFFVENLKAERRVGDVQAMILLDMVGDADLNVTMPANSTGRLVQRVLSASGSLGAREKFSYGATPLTDDHVPFLSAGIDSVDIIDFEFGSGPGRNDDWHTEQDSLERVSAGSLETVGRVTLKAVSGLR